MVKTIKGILDVVKKISWDWSQPARDYSSYMSYKLRSKSLRNFSIAATLLFVFIQALMPSTINALNPKFNFLPGDYELLRGANSTTGEQNWHDPITGKIGDVISWNVYYHNGVVGSTAHNTTIQMSLPQTSSNQLVVSGKLWAENAEAVADTGTLNITGDSGKLRYIPGSTIWYKEGSTTPAPLPDGIVENGVNIGDIKGCWQYAGFVVFQTEIITAKPSLYLDKKVGNSTTDPNSQNWYKENTAKPNEYLAYKLFAKNTGNEIAKNLKVRDQISEHTTYVAGSTRIFTSDSGPAGIKLPDGITAASGLNLGNFKPGDLNAGFIVFQVKIDNITTPGVYTLCNTALIKADNAPETQSTATTVVTIGASNIQKSKSAYNLTQSKDATTTIAKPGDEIRYTLSTKNTGDGAAENYVASDDIADILEYATLIDPEGGVLIGSNISYPGFDIQKSETINKTFRVKIKNPIPNNPQSGKSFDFVMENVYGNVIKINIFKPQIGVYFNKQVRNVSRGENKFTETTQATYGEELEYKIDVANTGNIDIANVKVWDILPQYQTLILGTVKFIHGKGITQLQDSLTTTGITLDKFSAGLSGSIIFRVRLASCPPAGTYNLVNTAFAISSATGQISDTAKVSFVIFPPIEPPVK